MRKERYTAPCADWKAFGESLSGCVIPDFDDSAYVEEYKSSEADVRYKTFLGKFIFAALDQKSMVTTKIFKSGNLLAGFSVDSNKRIASGMKEYLKLAEVKEKMFNE